jgi:hypothetical protein
MGPTVLDTAETSDRPSQDEITTTKSYTVLQTVPEEDEFVPVDPKSLNQPSYLQTAFLKILASRAYRAITSCHCLAVEFDHSDYPEIPDGVVVTASMQLERPQMMDSWHAR